MIRMTHYRIGLRYTVFARLFPGTSYVCIVTPSKSKGRHDTGLQINLMKYYRSVAVANCTARPVSQSVNGLMYKPIFTVFR